jgi:hypothetical protein
VRHDYYGWLRLCQVLEVPPILAKRVWRALCQCSTSRATTLRYHLACMARQPDLTRAESLLTGALRPQAVVETLEDLVRHDLLCRADANLVEERALAAISANGTWK